MAREAEPSDLECALYISEALCNLKEEYPLERVNRANEAFGRLILGRLGLVQKIVTVFPSNDCPYTKQEVR